MATLLIVSSAQADYSSHAGSAEFVKTMVEKHNFDKEWVQAILKQAEAKQSILDAMSRPAESVMTWERYRKIFIQDSRVTQGVQFWEEHRDELARAEKEYGVPASMIVGIIGVETRYGRNTGSYRVVDALATLGFDFPRRSKFFLGQLEEYMLMVREQGIEPFSLKGSYAGAMGFGQFIPSSYRAYAVDFDGDGKVDIVNSSVDAIGSVANYFKRHGWRYGEPVVSSAVIKEGVDQALFNTGLKPVKTVAQFRDAGITTKATLDAAQKATAMRLDGADGDEYWVGLKNFYVITRYNHSAMYAMAAYQLSQLIDAKMHEVSKP
ncbi:Membrane-bound lytic murein transglycosylase B [Zhongshania aliphaticivorans]|uniref:Membrane-bound lytic murein transglycosylase B n=1 Tax=Zhongshania aliphaticivorans TaxID=1470434 RepID=A0A5S9NVB6_9GAMM|nr:lytic murein transglycosylase B [Zhongshania aliphaticivorans]CAA0094592.1 Membrane-bound lytic murein transglycosylase B [Zhongshania aliphaticivorans]CAA0112576.1 Membrane-bound lytic murein transglycosylase B [Zhongshania aliphaticivorans]